MSKEKTRFLRWTVLLLFLVIVFVGIGVLLFTPQTATAAGSSADLKRINIHFSTFSPEFKPEITNYNVTLDAIVRDSINFYIVASDARTEIAINGRNYGSGETTVSLPFSPVYSITATGSDGSTKTYTLNVTRSQTNTTLTKMNKLEVRSRYDLPCLPLSPAFDPNITDYTVTLDEMAWSIITLSFCTVDPNAKIRINGKEGGGCGTYSVPLKPKMVMEVIGRDGSTKTYTVTVLPCPTGSTVAKLKNLEISSRYDSPCLPLSPAFEPNITDYTVTLDEMAWSRIILSIYTVDSNAKVRINDEKECGGGVITSVPLKPKMVIEVIGSDGSTKTYTVTVLPCPTGSAAAKLKRLEVRSSLASPFKTFALSPAFDPDTTDYTVTLDESVKEGVVLSLSPVDYNAHTAINGVDYGISSGAVGVPLTSKISIEITGLDGSTKTYTLTMVGASGTPSLSDIPPNTSDIPKVIATPTTPTTPATPNVTATTNPDSLFLKFYTMLRFLRFLML